MKKQKRKQTSVCVAFTNKGTRLGPNLKRRGVSTTTPIAIGKVTTARLSGCATNKSWSNCNVLRNKLKNISRIGITRPCLNRSCENSERKTQLKKSKDSVALMKKRKEILLPKKTRTRT